MKIKQSILLILVGILMIPVSCTDNLLDQINTNAVSTGNFWSNAADAELAEWYVSPYYEYFLLGADHTYRCDIEI